MTKKRVSIFDIAKQFAEHLMSEHIGNEGFDVTMDELRHILTEDQLAFLKKLILSAFVQGGVFCATNPQSVNVFKRINDIANMDIEKYKN